MLGSKAADGIKVADELTSRWRDDPGLSGGSNVITNLYVKGKPERQRQRFEDSVLLAFEGRGRGHEPRHGGCV